MLDTERYWQEEWAARVLRWARGKTRTAQEAEDLAQTVLLEWLRAVRAQEERGVCVAEPEHLLWRIARFVWCKSLRPGRITAASRCRRSCPPGKRRRNPPNGRMSSAVRPHSSAGKSCA